MPEDAESYFGQFTAAESARLAALKDAVAKQQKATADFKAGTANWTVDANNTPGVFQHTVLESAVLEFVAPLPETECRGAGDGGALGFTSRESAELSRMEKGLAYKDQRRKECRDMAVEVFEGRRDALQASALAALVIAARSERRAM